MLQRSWDCIAIAWQQPPVSHRLSQQEARSWAAYRAFLNHIPLSTGHNAERLDEGPSLPPFGVELEYVAGPSSCEFSYDNTERSQGA